MENELKQKLCQVIENNFSKAESEVLVKLVKERDDLTNENRKQKEELERNKEIISQKNSEISFLTKDRDEYRALSSKHAVEAKEYKEIHDK